MEISASILDIEDDFSVKVYQLENLGIRSFHVDVMDGKFVSTDNVDSMYNKLSTLNQISIMKKDVHLMTYDLERNIDLFSFLMPNSISFHIEAVKDENHAKNLIKRILNNNIYPGMAINPDTHIEEIYDYLPYLSKVIVMSVVAGKGGQKFIPETIERIDKLKKYIEEKGLDVIIEVDGGVNANNIDRLRFLEVDEAIVRKLYY